MQNVTKGFQDFYGLSHCHGTIDDTHFTISKPNKAFLKDYYYHKWSGYNIVSQLVLHDL